METKPTVISPAGRLDASRAPELEQLLRDHLAQGHINLLIDLAATTYISSNGLRILLAILKSARQSGGMLRLCCLSGRLKEIFEMVGFDQVFEIYQDRDTAESAFAGS
ncbi:MAG: STAS domain-containing protein [Rudaea sp.]